jgi:hypothetical protein
MLSVIYILAARQAHNLKVLGSNPFLGAYGRPFPGIRRALGLLKS